MARDNPYVPKARSVNLGKFILVLSFFLPYIFAYPNHETFMSFMIYAPNWVLQERSSLIYGGFSPMALIMFQFWLPYTFIGFQAYRYAKGRCSGEKSYLLSVILLTIVAVLLVLPLSLMPSGSTGTEDIYTTYVPLPLISVIAFLSVRRLAPTRVVSPWTKDTEEIKSDTKEESVWPE
ncbi:MAG: hypothetical protein OEV85_11875 [Candidatus Thorarchaeota archaeon]|nr:hypothetical protein [Candidatus Thorarchaeota archaeon]